MSKQKPPSEAVTYKVPEAAKVARVGTAAIRNGVRAGTIPHIRFGRNILIPKAAFLRWLDSCGQEPSGGRVSRQGGGTVA